MRDGLQAVYRVTSPAPYNYKVETYYDANRNVVRVDTEEQHVAEIKACKALLDEHVAQILGYLRASGIEHGLLINFGPGKFEIRKLILTRHHAGPEPDA
jgi:GxxExxY protein